MMRSIMSVTLTAVMLLSVLTGCGRSNDSDTPIPAATDIPGQTATTERPDTAPGGDMGDAGDRTENAADGMIGGAENAMDDIVDATKNTMDDILGDDGAVNGDFNDGDVADPGAKDETAATPQAR